MKATAIAPSNIALVKYWGKKDEILRLPQNSSFSVNLDNLITQTTVEFSDDLRDDEVIFNGQESKNKERVLNHIGRIRQIAGIKTKTKVVTSNNFPAAAGIASSASGFAALTLAGAAAAKINLSEKELSVLARQGSGSACRSIPPGFVEWFAADKSEDSYAVSRFSARHWDICDIVAIVSNEKKDVPSTAGQKLAQTSPFFKTRIANIPQKIEKIKNCVAEKNFRLFGELIESEAMELHAIMLTSTPPLVYWNPETVKLIKFIENWRRQGLAAYCTIDAGPNLHIFTESQNAKILAENLASLSEVKQTIINRPAEGAKLSDRHLF